MICLWLTVYFAGKNVYNRFPANDCKSSHIVVLGLPCSLQGPIWLSQQFKSDTHGVDVVSSIGVARGGQRGAWPSQIFRKYSHFVL